MKILPSEQLKKLRDIGFGKDIIKAFPNVMQNRGLLAVVPDHLRRKLLLVSEVTDKISNVPIWDNTCRFGYAPRPTSPYFAKNVFTNMVEVDMLTEQCLSMTSWHRQLANLNETIAWLIQCGESRYLPDKYSLPVLGSLCEGEEYRIPCILIEDENRTLVMTEVDDRLPGPVVIISLNL